MTGLVISYVRTVYLSERSLIGDRVVLRVATEADADMLVAWHAQPDISRQWDHETFSHDEIIARLRRNSVDPYVIEEDGKPVGYIQAWFDDDESRAGLDMFLIASARGRGLGSDAARTLTRWVLAQPLIHRVTVDVYTSNTAALKAWEKAGFHVVSQEAPDEENEEPWLLMVVDRDPRSLEAN
jgi:aminoglycoside 6'-N-acetyltransferase